MFAPIFFLLVSLITCVLAYVLAGLGTALLVASALLGWVVAFAAVRQSNEFARIVQDEAQKQRALKSKPALLTTYVVQTNERRAGGVRVTGQLGSPNANLTRTKERTPGVEHASVVLNLDGQPPFKLGHKLRVVFIDDAEEPR